MKNGLTITLVTLLSLVLISSVSWADSYESSYWRNRASQSMRDATEARQWLDDIENERRTKDLPQGELEDIIHFLFTDEMPMPRNVISSGSSNDLEMGDGWNLIPVFDASTGEVPSPETPARGSERKLSYFDLVPPPGEATQPVRAPNQYPDGWNRLDPDMLTPDVESPLSGSESSGTTSVGAVSTTPSTPSSSGSDGFVEVAPSTLSF